MAERDLSIAEAAGVFGVSERTLYRWVREGCPADGGGRGRPLRFDRAEVLAWMSSVGATGLPGRPPDGAERDGAERDGGQTGTDVDVGPEAGDHEPEEDDVDDDGTPVGQVDPARLATLIKRVSLEIKRLERRRRERLERVAAGELLDRAEVERGRLERIAHVRAGLLALPAKLAPQVAGRDHHEVHVIVEREVRALLRLYAGEEAA
ncbi:MAG: helix-turn-helix domain-containing protein [Planctomycetes bacterium]|nr:helix-turn-helix domain-containing protein [Planctomycetota bacterium]